jgi:hypothetical protein
VSVQKAVESFGAFGQFGQVSVLQGLRERVEKAPDVTPLKYLMTRLSPFMKHFRDQPVGAHIHIGRTDDEGVGIGVMGRRSGWPSWYNAQTMTRSMQGE